MPAIAFLSLMHVCLCIHEQNYVYNVYSFTLFELQVYLNYTHFLRLLKMAKQPGLKDGVVTVRLVEAEVEKLDRVAGGKLSRSQIIRLIVQDFIDKSEQEQKEFLIKSLFR